MYGEEWLNNIKLIVDTASEGLFVVYSLLMGVFFARLTYPFLYEKRKLSTLAGVLYAAFMTANTVFFPFDFPRGVGSVIRISVGFLILYAIDRTRPRQKLFISLLFYTIVTLCMQLNSEQSMYMSDFLFDVLPFNSTPMRTVILFFVSELWQAAFFGISVGIGVWLSGRFICLHDEDISVRDLIFLALPFLIIFSQVWVFSDYYDLYSKYFVLLDDIGDTSTLQNLSYNSMPRLFNMVLFYVFILTFVWCFFDIKRISRENVYAAVLSEQTAALRSHVKKMDDMYGRIRSIMHDINHHLEVLSALLDEGKDDEAREYLSSMKDFARESRPDFSTGNPITDIIISEKAAEAQELGICFKSDFIYPVDFGIDIFDISGILGNAFSNAFKACEGEIDSYISISTVIKKNIFLIEMKNSYRGKLMTDKKTGFPKSSDPAPGHGIGMQNMQRIAKKYGGDVTIEQRDNEVILAILLQRQTGENEA